MDKLNNTMENKWISVNDRLPDKEGVDYLVTDGLAQMVAVFRNNRWAFFGNDFWITSDVTHWMPLPELPKP